MSVRFRADRNKYEASVVIRGRRVRTYHSLKKDALDLDKKAKLKKLNLDQVEVEKIEIASGFADYFKHESSRKSEMSKSNDRWYFNLANYFLTSDRGIEFLDQVTLQDLEALQKWLKLEQVFKEIVVNSSGEEEMRDRKKPAWSASSVNRAFHTLNHFFARMCAWEKLSKNPAQYLAALPEQKVEKKPLTFEIYEKVMAHAEAPAWFRDVMEFIYGLGPRPTSVERFEWSRVNFKERWLELDSKKGAGAVTKVIRLPMTDRIFALLVRMRNKWPEATGEVFRYETGEPVRADRISKVGNRLIHACGYPDVVLYGARHGLAAELIDAGASTIVVQQLLGHANIQTTQGYAKNTKSETLLKNLNLVRGPSLAPDGTNDEIKIPIASGDLE